jgi:lipoprotein-anchoring transpeptidase ErfK/SrfK
MQKIFKNNTLTFTGLILFLILIGNLYAIDNPVKGSGNDTGLNVSNKSNEIDKEKLYFETSETESSDQLIREHVLEQFPIISDDDLNKILLTKTITTINNSPTDSTLNSASGNTYRVSFEVPKNFLVDTAKILWVLNLPSFESKLYQLYEGKEIYIDTWPNVIGKAGTKTYTGNFQAYRIRNWPFYKDPEPDKASLPPTPPGPGNPLGLFVVHYDQNSLRYFHGTNKNGLLSSKMRNLSHGCVRNDNGNIAKMKEFIIKRVVKSKDLSGWLNSKKTLIYDFEEIDKFPVKITYNTFEMDKDQLGNYIILYKDIYNYSNSNNIDEEWNDAGLITLTNKDNLKAEYRKKFGKDIQDEALDLIIDYLINNGEEYEKYYVEDLKSKFMLKN